MTHKENTSHPKISEQTARWFAIRGDFPAAAADDDNGAYKDDDDNDDNSKLSER